MKHLIGITAFGGLPFLELCLRSIQETLTKPNVDVLVVIAKPGDHEMREFLWRRDFNFIIHEENKGFPGSINDLLDTAFVDGSYDTLTILGNDTVLMPGAIDTMIEHAETSDWDMLCGSEFDVRFLYNTYPEVRHLFTGLNLVFSDFSQRPWEAHKDFRENTVQPDTLKDVRNFTLYKRRVFEVVGYADASFFPNGYWEDLDYARRCHLLGIRAAGLPSASFFHFWSRTLHQGQKREHDKFYQRNETFYAHKWGRAEWTKEIYTTPFNGGPYKLGDILLPPTLEIPDRDLEPSIIRHWASLP